MHSLAHIPLLKCAKRGPTVAVQLAGYCHNTNAGINECTETNPKVQLQIRPTYCLVVFAGTVLKLFRNHLILFALD
jgi:hypothetical protein